MGDSCFMGHEILAICQLIFAHGFITEITKRALV